jgi:hypothetical protein
VTAPCCSQRATVAKLRAIKLPTGKLRAPRNQQYTTEVSQPGDTALEEHCFVATGVRSPCGSNGAAFWCPGHSINCFGAL